MVISKEVFRGDIERSAAAFAHWAEQNPQSLQIPDYCLGLLVPPRMTEVVEDSSKLRVFYSYREKDIFRGGILQETDIPVTDIDFFRRTYEYGSIADLVNTARVDYYHVQFSEELYLGQILPNESILSVINLQVVDGDILWVSNFGLTPRLRYKKIGTSFYDQLGKIAEMARFGAIAGTNDKSNEKFFLEKQGRKRLNEFPEGFINRFRFSSEEVIRSTSVKIMKAV